MFILALVELVFAEKNVETIESFKTRNRKAHCLFNGYKHFTGCIELRSFPNLFLYKNVTNTNEHFKT